ncbi:MAG TPA: ABC transporter permease [Longimicrobiales bacterium]|nr:ABC transporter permease [Longimicrobiales bacterium]
MMTNVWAVIRREYLQRVRSKWFVISTVGGPLFMIALTVLPAYFAAKGERADRKIVVVDRTGVLYDRLQPRMDEAGYEVASEPWTSDVVVSLTQRATNDDIGAFIVLDEETLHSGKAMFYGTERPSAIRRVTLRSAIVQSALEVELSASGVDAQALLSGGDLQVEVLSAEGAGIEDPRFLVAYTGAFFLYMVILLYSIAVMRATLEEKTSRVVEIIISSMKPWHLMLGKILGVGGVGLTQMAVWLGSAAVLASAGLPALMAARPEMANLGQIRDVLPGLGLMALFLGFFVFGFFMFSGLYAAVGAMCNTDEEAQQAQFPVIMLLIVPILFVMNVIQNPSTPLSVGLSLFPFFTPVLMWARVAGGGAPAWQIAVSFVLMGGATLAVAWLAGRIYKVGILMAGKRPTLPELWRWVREA